MRPRQRYSLVVFRGVFVFLVNPFGIIMARDGRCMYPIMIMIMIY